MVDFYQVFDTVEEFGGWQHYMTNSEDAVSAWFSESDNKIELIFWNWDLTGYNEDPCGLKAVDNRNEENLLLSEIILEGSNDVENDVWNFLNELEDQI